MDSAVLSSKLEALRRCVQRIRDKTPASVQYLLDDYDLQDIISLNLERAVQACVDMASHIIADTEERPPATMAASFDSLRELGIISADLAAQMKKAVGFRNISVHSYQEIDWEIVYAIITTRLDDFSRFARSMERMLEDTGT